METEKIKLPFRAQKSILALGSQTKNTLCFAHGRFLYVSPVHADLGNLSDFLQFEKEAEHFLKKKPGIIACDLHPEYQSSKFAESLEDSGYKRIAIQHHHAHIASCMLEQGLMNQKVIGVAFDGTGLGSDGRLWGGEFLVCDYRSFARMGHIKEIPLLGGEKAVLEPWRLAAAWLYQIYKDKFLHLKIGFIRGMDKKKWVVLKKMYLGNFYAPGASSMGRLFDAVASLVLEKYRVCVEAELPMAFEKLASGYLFQAEGYPFDINRENGWVLDPSLMFKQIVLDLKAGVPQEEIAYRFHRTVAEMIKRICLILRKENGIKKVVLSGGVFQNRLLLSLARDSLEGQGFRVMTHGRWPAHDACVSLGQAVITHFRS